MSAHIIITGKLAETVGRLAKEHPDAAVHIDYTDGDPEEIWEVMFTDWNGPDRSVTIDDETGRVMGEVTFW